MEKQFTIKKQVYTAIISKGDKFYIAECKELNTFTQGKTIKESLKNLKEATELYLEVFPMKQLVKIREPFSWGIQHDKTSSNVRS